MPEKRTLPQTMTYESEWTQTLDRLIEETRHLPSFSYFVRTAYEWFAPAYRRAAAPAIVVAGPGLPEELLYAAGGVPTFVLGGSLKAAAWAEDLVPRDADPVSRSMLGFLQEASGPRYEDTLFLVPLTNDSQRKIAGLLREQGRKVHGVDVPPQRRDPASQEKWAAQLRAMTAAAADHLKTRVTAKSLMQAVAMTDQARGQLRLFLAVTAGREDLLSLEGRLLVQNSYYYTRDLPGWTRALAALNQELSALRRATAPRQPAGPGVLLVGSPVYFPNYKVPSLLREVGLTVLRNLDATTQKLALPKIPKGRSREELIRAVAARWYGLDASPAFVSNDVLYQAVGESLKTLPLEGVVVHVLKGQIEVDFELERLERLLDRYGVPVFRLETDYQYQDVEQLRIRLEAFSEMLRHNRRREERMAQ